MMQLFQESNDWTPCSFWVGSRLEDTLCSSGRFSLGSGNTASGANHEVAAGHDLQAQSPRVAAERQGRRGLLCGQLPGQHPCLLVAGGIQ